MALGRVEMEILRYMVRGLSDRDIAAAMGLSAAEVARIMNNLARECGTASRAQTIVFAMRKGWITS